MTQILDIRNADMKTWAKTNFFVLFLLLQPLLLRWLFILMSLVCRQTIKDAVSGLSTYLCLWGFTTPARFTLFFILSPRGSNHHLRFGARPWVGFTYGNENRVFALGHTWYWTRRLGVQFACNKKKEKISENLTLISLSFILKIITKCKSTQYLVVLSHIKHMYAQICHYALNWYHIVTSVWYSNFCHIAAPHPFIYFLCVCL